MQNASAFDPQSKLINSREAADYLGVPRATLWRWCRERGLPHIRINSRVWRFRLPDLVQWLNERAR
jgi:excisionase family DNA binding protein